MKAAPVLGITAIILILVLVAQTLAQTQTKLVTSENLKLTDAREFEGWLDGLVTSYAGGSPLPSIGVVVIKDGETFLQKGYGFVDLENTQPVVPDHTVFRAASVSKLLTATAVLQLVERGQLKLDDDVNIHLKRFQIPSDYSAPITVASLLTHTSGLEDGFIGNSLPHIASRPSLGDYFSRNIPRRIRAPNEEIAYSNRGMALAGHLVESVSGMSFEEYVERNIFEPLGMTRSSFRQPYPTHLAKAVVPSGADESAIIPYPSGSMISTVSDMGRFIAAHLNGGSYGNSRILEQVNIDKMHSRQFSQHPQMPGVAYGFFENFTNGRRVLFHTGLSGHNSLLCLLPEEGIGFYLVLSARQGGRWQDFKTHFLQALMDRYFPSKAPSALRKAPADSNNRAGRFVGTYRPHLLPQTTIETLGNLAADTQVKANADGSLSVALPPLGAKHFRLVEVAPLLFRTDEGFYFSFGEDKQGNIKSMFMSGSVVDPVGFERLRWYQVGLLHAGLAAAGFLTFSSCLGFTIIGFLLSRFRSRDESAKSATSMIPRFAWRTAMLVSTLVIASPIIALAVYFVGDPAMRPYKITTALYPALSLLALAALIGLTLPVFAVLIWRGRHWSVARRVYFSVVALVALLMPFYLYHWNLLGFRF